MSRRWVGSGTVLLTGASLLAGCGGAKKLDAAPTEKAIAISIAQQRHQIAVVACPNDVEKQKGKSFRCVAVEKSGRRTFFRVTQKDDKGNVHYEATR